MKRFWMKTPLFLLAVLLFISACGGNNDRADGRSENAGTVTEDPSGEDEGSEAEETTAPYTGVLPEMDPVSPTGEADPVPASVRAYLAASEAAYAGENFEESVKVLNQAFTDIEPVMFRWDLANGLAIDDTIPFSLEFSETEDFKNAMIHPCASVQREAVPQQEAVYNLMTGTHYYWRVRAHLPNGAFHYSAAKEFTTAAGPRILRIEGVENARDLGGWPTENGGTVRQGMIFRAAKLEGAYLSGILLMRDELGIRTEIDLRNPNSEDVVTPFADGSVYVVNYTGSSYMSFINNPTAQAETLRLLAKPSSYPVIFHCLGGADRTGALAFLLNAHAGVSAVHLVQDYELTKNRFVTGYVTSDHNFDFPSFYLGFLRLPGDILQDKAAFYMKSAGLSAMEIYNIRALLTGDTAVFTDPPKMKAVRGGGEVRIEIDPRSSGTIVSVKEKNSELSFRFEDGELILAVEQKGSGEILFEDGTVMPLVWK